MCSAAPRTFNKLWKFPKHKYPCWTASRTPCSRDQGDEWIISIRGGIQKKPFFWEIFSKCGWVGWLIPKQGPTPSKNPQITAKIAFFDPNFTFCFPKSRKNPGVGGWVNTFGKDLQKKQDFFYTFPRNMETSLWKERERNLPSGNLLGIEIGFPILSS